MAKVAFLVSVAKTTVNFSRQYQEDKPMLPFLTNDWACLIQLFIKGSSESAFLTDLELETKKAEKSFGETDPAIENLQGNAKNVFACWVFALEVSYHIKVGSDPLKCQKERD